MVRWYRSRTSADPGWGRVLAAPGAAAAWREALERARGGPRVLVATSLGGFWAGTTLESLLAVALTLRGARVQVLLCDGVLPACQLCEARAFSSLERFARRGPRGGLCDGCYGHGKSVFEGLGIPALRMGAYLEPGEVEAARRAAASAPPGTIGGYELDGAPVGEHALAGALRFFARGDLEGEPQAEPILRRYLEAAILAYRASRRLLEAEGIERAVFHHGIYVPQGLIGEAARRLGVPVANWNPAYRKRCFVFSHGGSYHHTLLDEPVEAWEGLDLGPEREAELLRYLRSRRKGTEDWIWFHKDPREDVEREARALGIDLSRPFAGLLTNVIWDAQLHYPRSAFPSMMDWISGTVRRFASRPDLQLVIRVHPAEVRGTLPSRQRVGEELRRAFPRLPPNVVVVPPESRLSTYALMECADAALIFGTKTGVELAAMGIPVIVAGEAWVRGKGFTLDAESEEGYYRLLDRLPLGRPMEPRQVERARRYAYHFFFRRMVPVDCMEPTGRDPPYALRLASLDDLRPGRMPGLDVILDGILRGSPFVYPAEELARLGREAPAPAEAVLESAGER